MSIIIDKVVLPDIPIDVMKSNLPYVVITDIGDNNFRLYASKNEFVCDGMKNVSSTLRLVLTTFFSYVSQYRYDVDTNQWVILYNHEPNTLIIDADSLVQSRIWSNHDIHYLYAYNPEVTEYIRHPEIWCGVNFPKFPEDALLEYQYYIIIRRRMLEAEHQSWYLVTTKEPVGLVESMQSPSGKPMLVCNTPGNKVWCYSPMMETSLTQLGSNTTETHFWINYGTNDGYLHEDVTGTVKDMVVDSNHDIYIIYDYVSDDYIFDMSSELYFVNPHKKIVNDSHYKAIASKVREILCEETQYKPRELPDAIKRTSDILNTYNDITTGIVIRKSVNTNMSDTLYPGVYTFDEYTDSTIVIPENITKIAPYACRYVGVNNIIFNNKTATIGDYAFDSSYDLTSLELPDSVTSIGIRAFTSTKITTLTIPVNVKTMGLGAFFYNNSLTDVTILANNVTELYATFHSCKLLKCVDIKGRITYITYQAFNGCAALDTLILRSNSRITLSYANAFDGTPIASGTGYIYVPSTLLSSYKSAKNWSTFSAQFRAIEDYPEICDPTT